MTLGSKGESPSGRRTGRVVDGRDGGGATRGATARVSWDQPEVAWLIGTAFGFTAAWAGVLSGFSGAGGFVAAAAAMLLQFVLLRRGRDGTAGMVAVSACLGVTLAGVGLVFERGYDDVAPAFPLASTFVEREIRPLLAGALDGSLRSTALSAGAALVLLVLARPTRGLAPLAAGSIAAGALGVAGGWRAAADSESSPEVIDGIFSIPPWALLQLAGVLLAQAGLAGAERVFPLEEMRLPRKRVLRLGLAALAVGLLAQPLLAGTWARWIGAPPA